MKIIFKKYVLNILNFYLLLFFAIHTSPLDATKSKQQSYIKLKESVPLNSAPDQHILKGHHEKLNQHKATLVGKHKIAKDAQGQHIVQMVWIGVANKQHDIALFKQPFTSSMRTKKNELSQGLNVPFTGDIKQLEAALAELEKGNINQSSKAVLQAHNQQSTSRRVNLDQVDQQGKKRGRNQDDGVATSSANPDNTNNTQQDGSASGYENAVGKASNNGSQNGGGITGYGSNLSGQDGIQSDLNGKDLNNLDRNNAASNGRNLNGGDSSNPDNLSTRDSSQSGVNNKNPNWKRPGYPGDHTLSDSLSGQDGGQSGLSNRSANGRTEGSQNRNGSRVPGGSGYGSSNFDFAQPGFAGNQGEGRHKDKSHNSQSSPVTALPQTTYEPCDPRIDEVQKKVVIQSKSVTKQQGQTDKIGSCQDTFESYLIQRDYTDPDCTDLIKLDEGHAFTRYKKYWVNGQGQRFDVSDRLYLEENRPHPFIEERGNCRARIDLGSMQAFAQYQTVYYGRGNKRVVVKECHDATDARSVPIILTAQGCENSHDFTKNTSKEYKRAIFTLGGISHEAKSCFEQDTLLSHRFDTAKPCKPIKDLATAQYTKMGRRFIELSNGERQYLSNVCEPTGVVRDLKFTSEGCRGYKDDYLQGKSYPKGRFYIEKSSGIKKFITSCAPGPISVAHINEVIGHHHDDKQKVSYLIHKISVKDNGKIVILKPQKVRFDHPPLPYTFVTEVTKKNPSKQAHYNGCYKLTPLAKFKRFKRKDGSFHDEFSSENGEKRSRDLCVREQEVKKEYEYTIDEGNCTSSNHYEKSQGKGWELSILVTTKTLNFAGTHTVIKNVNDFQFDCKNVRVGFGAAIYIKDISFERTKTIFPDGRIDHSEWLIKSTGELRPYGVIKTVILNDIESVVFNNNNISKNDMPGGNNFNQAKRNRYKNSGLLGYIRYLNTLPNRVNLK